MAKAKLLWTGQTRVYFNNWAEGPLFWSVDRGEPASEVKCAQIRIEGGSGRTVINTTSAGTEPRAWLLFMSANVYQVGDYVLIQ
jgi:hypothetical protein